MAKSAKKSAAKFGDATPTLAEKGYVKCPTCRRDVKDAEAHSSLHAKGVLGDDGKRTDRSKAEAEAWKSRYNGTEATEAYRAKKFEKRLKRAKSAKKPTKRAAKKVAVDATA